MTIWQAFLLGIIQGITEFLPVSSSGHLALFQSLLGLEHPKNYIFFDLICHLGTLFAIILIFFQVIKKSLNIYHSNFWQVFIGTLPLFPLVLVLKPIQSIFNDPRFLGPCFIFSSILLFLSQTTRLSQQPKKWRDSLMIGMFQAIAILPGISRSGATISAARMLGWNKETAIQFSFLLAIPAILGGIILESGKLWKEGVEIFSLDLSIYFAGFFTSFLIGLFSLWILIRWLVQDMWYYFGWYCLLLGIVTTLFYGAKT